MELVGRVRGTESMWIMNVAQQIILQIGLLLPVINEATVKELLSQVRSRIGVSPRRRYLRVSERLAYVAVSLGIDRKPKETPVISTSGIPPPVLVEVSLQHDVIKQEAATALDGLL